MFISPEGRKNLHVILTIKLLTGEGLFHTYIPPFPIIQIKNGELKYGVRYYSLKFLGRRLINERI